MGTRWKIWRTSTCARQATAALASPHESFIEIGAGEHPETANVFFRFEVGAVGDGSFAAGAGADGFRGRGGGQASEINSYARGFHLFVERDDVAHGGFGFLRWVEVVGVVDGDDVLIHGELL